MNKKIIRALAVALLLCMIPLPLFSCATEEPDETFPSESGTSNNSTPTNKESNTPNAEKETDKAGTITLFKNGSYVAKIIRADNASSTDMTLYSRIRAAFKAKTGKTVSNATDFVAQGEKLDESAAILVGETAYEESKSVYESLEEGTAVAKIINNKYVVAYKNNESLQKLLTALEAKIASASAEEIVIDSSWELKAESVKLVESVKLPDYNGKSLGTAIDIGQASELYIVDNTTLLEYASYLKDLEGLGFKAYTENTIGNNKFKTYITDTQIVNVMFLANANQVRIIQDARDSIELPALKSANIYTNTSTPSFTMMGISDAGYPGGMSFIYKLSDGTFFIIDGGICKNRGVNDNESNECSGEPSVHRLYKTLRELADDPDKIVISGWLITHIHNDHAGSFIDLADETGYLNNITIKQVIYSQPSDSDMSYNKGGRRNNWMPNALNKMKIEKTVKAHPGQVFYYADLTLTIIGTHDLVKPASLNSHNNASIVSFVEFGGKKALYLADAEGDANAQLKKLYGENLKADIVQVAHHGYNNTKADIVYPYVNPSIVLWPIQTSDYKSGDNVYNQPLNKPYFNKSGINNYCAGDANTTFENLTTWAPTKTNWKPA